MGAITGRVLDREQRRRAPSPGTRQPRAASFTNRRGSCVRRSRRVSHLRFGAGQVLDPNRGTHSRRRVSNPADLRPRIARSPRVPRHAVNVYEETAYADIQPQFGRLFHVGGRIACDSLGAVTVRLSSDSGVRATGGACAGQYAFDGVAPRLYEVYATAAHGVSAGFIELTLDRDTESASVSANGASAGGAHNAPPEFQCSRKHSRESQRPAAGPVGSRSRTRYRDAKNHVAPGRWELKGARVQANSSSPSSIRVSARVVPRSIHTPTGSMFSSKRDLMRKYGSQFPIELVECLAE